MADVGRHPNISLFTLSEVTQVSGHIGNFHVKVHRRARFVDEKECTACNDCIEVCPVALPDEFNMGFSTRRAIYQPFPQAVPSAFVVNPEECLGNNPIACGKCIDACEKKCIDFDMADEDIEFDVGTIIVATGMDVFDPTPLEEYGYGRFRNVITSLEFERLISSFGPTKGELIRPTDGQVPKNVAFIQCVGSRTEKKGKPYCSNICCMNTVKDTLLIKDHWPQVDCKVFYIDIRAFGKGFEDLYKRSRGEGVEYIRGIPGLIEEDPETGDLELAVENVQTGRVEHHRVGMVVLSIGVEPRRDGAGIKNLLSLSHTPDGFYMEAHPKLMPVDAPTRGVFFAGCAEGPKDVKDSVSQAGAAAARANRLMRKGLVRVEAITSVVDPGLCRSCGICVGVCPYHAITVDKERKLPAEVVEAACGGCGTCAAECPFGAISMCHFSDGQIEVQIDAALAESPQEKVLVFACNWCSYAGADTAGITRLQYPPSARIIRTMCSGRVHSKFIERAFTRGAAIVLVSGCHFADCHYINANRWTQKRVEKMWNKLEKLGIRPERLQLEWISAAEGQKFARTMAELEEMRKKVTPEEIEHTIQAFTESRKPRSGEKRTGAKAEI